MPLPSPWEGGWPTSQSAIKIGVPQVSILRPGKDEAGPKSSVRTSIRLIQIPDAPGGWPTSQSAIKIGVPQVSILRPGKDEAGPKSSVRTPIRLIQIPDAPGGWPTSQSAIKIGVPQVSILRPGKDEADPKSSVRAPIRLIEIPMPPSRLWEADSGFRSVTRQTGRNHKPSRTVQSVQNQPYGSERRGRGIMPLKGNCRPHRSCLRTIAFRRRTLADRGKSAEATQRPEEQGAPHPPYRFSARMLGNINRINGLKQYIAAIIGL
jgi:hypothetical protein